MTDLLLISPMPTHPTNEGARVRIKALLEFFEEHGVRFHIAFVRQDTGDEPAMIARWGEDRCSFFDFNLPSRTLTINQRLKRKLDHLRGRPMSLPHGIDDWCTQPLLDSVQELADRLQPKCVQIEFVFFSGFFNCFGPETFRILDTHDVYSIRHKSFTNLGLEADWFYTTPSEETIGLNRADCVVAIQSNEAAQFKKMTAKPVVTVGHLVDLRPPAKPTSAAPTVIFLASENVFNLDALNYLLQEIWPAVRAAIPQAALEIYGGVCKYPIPETAGVTLIGVVDDLATAYERAWVVVSPLRTGTGLKIKTIEALGIGKALVAAPAGYVGLEDGRGTAYLAGDSAEEFAAHCIEILGDESRRTELERAAYEFARVWNERQRSALIDILRSARILEPASNLP